MRNRSGIEPVLPSGIDPTPGQRSALRTLAGVRSVYLWGPPGSGKTTLLDAVAEASPTSVRLHLAEYFARLHREIHRVGAATAHDRVCGGAGVVCLDEFHLHDVADAVFLGRALERWEKTGVRVVVTSNYAPESLLPHPLYHSAAEPVIALVRRRFEVIALDDGVDHRAPGCADAVGFGAGKWVEEGGGSPAAGALTVTFASLCERPMSAADYFDLLDSQSHVVVVDVPHPATMGRDPAQRFANLVDACCDRGARLDLVGPGGPQDLRCCPEPPLDVERTVSRLTLLGTG